MNRRDVEMEMRKKKLPIGIDNFEKQKIFIILIKPGSSKNFLIIGVK